MFFIWLCLFTKPDIKFKKVEGKSVTLTDDITFIFKQELCPADFTLDGEPLKLAGEPYAIHLLSGTLTYTKELPDNLLGYTASNKKAGRLIRNAYEGSFSTNEYIINDTPQTITLQLEQKISYFPFDSEEMLEGTTINIAPREAIYAKKEYVTGSILCPSVKQEFPTSIMTLKSDYGYLDINGNSAREIRNKIPFECEYVTETSDFTLKPGKYILYDIDINSYTVTAGEKNLKLYFDKNLKKLKQINTFYPLKFIPKSTASGKEIGFSFNENMYKTLVIRKNSNEKFNIHDYYFIYNAGVEDAIITFSHEMLFTKGRKTETSELGKIFTLKPGEHAFLNYAFLSSTTLDFTYSTESKDGQTVSLTPGRLPDEVKDSHTVIYRLEDDEYRIAPIMHPFTLTECKGASFDIPFKNNFIGKNIDMNNYYLTQKKGDISLLPPIPPQKIEFIDNFDEDIVTTLTYKGAASDEVVGYTYEYPNKYENILIVRGPVIEYTINSSTYMIYNAMDKQITVQQQDENSRIHFYRNEQNDLTSSCDLNPGEYVYISDYLTKQGNFKLSQLKITCSECGDPNNDNVYLTSTEPNAIIGNGNRVSFGDKRFLLSEMKTSNDNGLELPPNTLSFVPNINFAENIFFYETNADGTISYKNYENGFGNEAVIAIYTDPSSKGIIKKNSPNVANSKAMVFGEFKENAKGYIVNGRRTTSVNMNDFVINNIKEKQIKITATVPINFINSKGIVSNTDSATLEYHELVYIQKPYNTYQDPTLTITVVGDDSSTAKDENVVEITLGSEPFYLSSQNGAPSKPLIDSKPGFTIERVSSSEINPDKDCSFLSFGIKGSEILSIEDKSIRVYPEENLNIYNIKAKSHITLHSQRKCQDETYGVLIKNYKDSRQCDRIFYIDGLVNPSGKTITIAQTTSIAIINGLPGNKEITIKGTFKYHFFRNGGYLTGSKIPSESAKLSYNDLIYIEPTGAEETEITLSYETTNADANIANFKEISTDILQEEQGELMEFVSTDLKDLNTYNSKLSKDIPQFINFNENYGCIYIENTINKGDLPPVEIRLYQDNNVILQSVTQKYTQVNIKAKTRALIIYRGTSVHSSSSQNIIYNQIPATHIIIGDIKSWEFTAKKSEIIMIISKNQATLTPIKDNTLSITESATGEETTSETQIKANTAYIISIKDDKSASEMFKFASKVVNNNFNIYKVEAETTIQQTSELTNNKPYIPDLKITKLAKDNTLKKGSILIPFVMNASEIVTLENIEEKQKLQFYPEESITSLTMKANSYVSIKSTPYGADGCYGLLLEDYTEGVTCDNILVVHNAINPSTKEFTVKKKTKTVIFNYFNKAKITITAKGQTKLCYCLVKETGDSECKTEKTVDILKGELIYIEPEDKNNDLIFTVICPKTDSSNAIEDTQEIPTSSFSTNVGQAYDAVTKLIEVDNRINHNDNLQPNEAKVIDFKDKQSFIFIEQNKEEPITLRLYQGNEIITKEITKKFVQIDFTEPATAIVIPKGTSPISALYNQIVATRRIIGSIRSKYFTINKGETIMVFCKESGTIISDEKDKLEITPFNNYNEKERKSLSEGSDIEANKVYIVSIKDGNAESVTFKITTSSESNSFNDYKVPTEDYEIVSNNILPYQIEDDSGLSTTALVLIIIGVIVAVVLIAVAIFFFAKNRNKKQESSESDTSIKKEEQKEELE